MIRINLLPVRISRRHEAVRSELIIAGVIGGVLALLMAGAQISISADANAMRAENRQLTQEIERKKEIVEEVDQAEKLKQEFERKLSVIKKLKANKTGPVMMLDQLSQATPEKLAIQSLDENRKRLQIAGISVSNEVISQFLSNLEQSPYFDDVYLNAIDQIDQDGVKLKNFSITARLVVPGTSDGDVDG